MSEERVEAKTFIIKQKCETCNEGYMLPYNHHVLMSSPPQYGHACNYCGATQYYPVTYPFTEHVVANG